MVTNPSNEVFCSSAMARARASALGQASGRRQPLTQAVAQSIPWVPLLSLPVLAWPA
jgi:hypothetical protein